MSKDKYKVYETELSEFKPDPKNHNKHTLRGHKMVTNSMQNRGYARPGFAANDGTVLGGNLSTMEIAPSLGIGNGKVLVVETDGDIPIIHKRRDVAPDSTEARQLSYEDNFTGIFSFALDADVVMADIEAGFNFEAIDITLPDLGEMLEGAARELLRGNGQPPELPPPIDKAAQLKEKWGTALGQVWEMPSQVDGRPHRIVCGDCTDRAVVEAVMRGERADLWIADPPYGIGWQGSNASTLEWNEINGDKDTKTVAELFKLLPSEQAAVVWGANCFPELLPHRGRWICWDKRVTEEADKMIGSPFELAWMNKTHGFDVIIRVQHGGALNADGGARYHPTQKPIQLYTLMLHKSYGDAKIVFDPFLGSGTTLIAAHNLHRIARGIEIDPGYVAVTLERYHQAFGIQPCLIGDTGNT